MSVSTTQPTDLQTALAALQDDYTYRVNMLLDEGREDLAAALSDEFVAEAAILTRRHAA